MPDSVGNREATTFGISAATAMQAINQNLGMPWPENLFSGGRQSDPSALPRRVIGWALVRFYDLLPSLVGERLQTPPARVLQGDFASLLDGPDLLCKRKCLARSW